MNVIAKAVEPQRAIAIERAIGFAKQSLDAMKSKLEAAEWNLDLVAPYPKSGMGRPAYVAAKSLRTRYEMVTRSTGSRIRLGDPTIVVWAQDKADRFIEAARDASNAEFDAYIVKLTMKVGEATDAQLTGSLWSYSILTVTKPDGATERWSTQQILNVSSLGKVFNQWPTRKVK